MKTSMKNDDTATKDTTTMGASKVEEQDDNNVVDCELGGVVPGASSNTIASATATAAAASSKTSSDNDDNTSENNNKEDAKNSKKMEKSDTTTKKKNGIDDIQDLPSVQESTLYDGPGAHAVPGRPPQIDNDDFVQPSLVHIHNNSNGDNDDDDDEDHLINEAVVVVEDDEEEIGECQDYSATGASTTGMTNELVLVDKVIDDAKPPGVQQQRGPKLQWTILLLVTILSLTLLLIVFLVILPSHNNNNNNDDDNHELSQLHHLNPNDNNMPDGVYDDPDYVIPFQEDLNPVYIDDIETIGSPANLANKWMMQDPYLDSYSLSRQRQRFTLAALYYNLGGQHWYNSHYWLSYDINECYWYSTSLINYGIDVCDDDNNIISVSLSSNNLTGTFPLYFSHLPHLQVFDLENNNLYGILPALYTSSFLEIFAVAHNDLQGQLIGKGGFAALDLRVAKVNNNRFTGSLIVFQWLTKLEFVNVSSNEFNGLIPPQIQECQFLTYLGLSNNLYEGPIPSQLGLMSHLQEIDVSGNTMVNGTVPTELSNIDNLIKLDISNTSIEGSIPQELCIKQHEDNLEIIANCSSSTTTSGLVQCCHQSSS